MSKETILIKNKKREVRYFPMEELRVEQDEETKKKRIIGYAAVFNKYSEDLGGYREIIRPGAFKKTIKEADVRALFNHDPNYVLGRKNTTTNTLKLEEKAKGLRVEIEPPDTQWANDLIVSIGRGDIDQMSFGFQMVKQNWLEKKKENHVSLVRELLEVKLFDVSPVTFPAYPQTSVGLRKLSIADLQAALIKAEYNLTLEEKDIKLLIESRDYFNELVSEKPKCKSIARLKTELELVERY